MQATCQSNRFSFIVKFHGQWYSFSITDLPWNPQTWKKIVIWGYPYKQSLWGNLMFFFEPSYSFHIEYTFSSYLGSIALYLNSIKFGLELWFLNSLHLTNIQVFDFTRKVHKATLLNPRTYILYGIDIYRFCGNLCQLIYAVTHCLKTCMVLTETSQYLLNTNFSGMLLLSWSMKLNVHWIALSNHIL